MACATFAVLLPGQGTEDEEPQQTVKFYFASGLVASFDTMIRTDREKTERERYSSILLQLRLKPRPELDSTLTTPLKCVSSLTGWILEGAAADYLKRRRNWPK